MATTGMKKQFIAALFVFWGVFVRERRVFPFPATDPGAPERRAGKRSTQRGRAWLGGGLPGQTHLAQVTAARMLENAQAKFRQDGHQVIEDIRLDTLVIRP